MLGVAVGVIVGAGCGRLVTALTEDIFMPPLGVMMGRIDFKDLKIVIQSASTELGKDGKPVSLPEVAIRYGSFLNASIQLLFLAAIIYFAVRMFCRIRTLAEKAGVHTEGTKECPYCMSHIPQAATRCAHCTSQLSDLDSVGVTLSFTHCAPENDIDFKEIRAGSLEG